MRHLDYAKRYMVLVYQGYKKKYDMIQPVYFGDFLEELTPVVYFEVVDFGSYYMIVWCVFHRYDWKDTAFLPLKRADSHNLDFEGWLKIISKEDDRVLWGATRAHQELHFHEGDFHEVSIQPEGHGIFPGINPKEIDLLNVKRYLPDQFLYHNMKVGSFPKHIKPVLFKPGRKVTDWRDWNDYRIRDRRGMKSDEWITKNPAALFVAAKELGLV